MKKKLLSLLMALVMVFTLLPFNAIAAMRPLEETGSEETENEGTGSEEPGEGTGSTTLLSKEIHTVTHPTYLPSGEISLLNIISADAGLLSFTKGSTTVATVVLKDDRPLSDDEIAGIIEDVARLAAGER